ncbi:MAG: AAA family ATPase [Cytophagaceae bacterium]|nr:AAA family ATPase [Cytophagaceae bacterium]
MSIPVLYRQGLVLGKFMPLHRGHLALIEYALQHCDRVLVLLCVHEGEAIPASQRMRWLSDCLENISRIQLAVLEYDPAQLTNQSVSSEAETAAWAAVLQEKFPQVDVLVSSEKYGEIVTRYWNIAHLDFDLDRHQIPVSASQIRQQPWKYWQYLPEVVRPYYVKKVILLGTESTGKTVLTERLAWHFQTSFVSEAARELVSVTTECRYEDLEKIAIAHAQAILRKRPSANKLLFIDTDHHITQSYSWYLFQRELPLPAWIEEANRGDLYLFLQPDAPYVQDGTRLSEEERLLLHGYHSRFFNQKKLDCVEGKDWETRFLNAVNEVERWIVQQNL